MNQRYQGDHRPDDSHYGDRDRAAYGASPTQSSHPGNPGGQYQRGGSQGPGRGDWMPEQGQGDWNAQAYGPRPSAYEDYGNERGYAGADRGQYAGGSSYYGGGQGWRGDFGDQPQGGYRSQGPGGGYRSQGGQGYGQNSQGNYGQSYQGGSQGYGGQGGGYGSQASGYQGQGYGSSGYGQGAYGGTQGFGAYGQGSNAPGSQYVSDMGRGGGGYGGYGASSGDMNNPGQGTYASGYGSGGSYQSASPSSYQGGYGSPNQNRNYDQGGYGSVAGAWGDDQRYPSGHGSASQATGYRGMGPKGYKRSDERLQEDICERLTQDDAVDASDISVRASNGVVTLEGTVENRQLKHRIEDMIERCSGVSDIENRLTVRNRRSGSAKADGEDAGKQAGKKH